MPTTIENKLQVVILTCGDASRLLQELSNIPDITISGIVVESATKRERTFSEKLKRSIRYDGVYATLKKFVMKGLGAKATGEAGTQFQSEQLDATEAAAGILDIPLYRVDDYHSESSIDLIRRLGPDLGVLYGTNIIKESVFAIPKLGSINLHQGLAPLYRGGPTVFWELFNGEPEIGITIHFVAAKVDTGDIILQRTVPLEYDFAEYGLDVDGFLRDFRKTLKEPSVRMIGEAVDLIVRGEEKRRPQDISIGKRYRLPTKKEKDALTRRLKRRMMQTRDGRHAF